MSPKTLYDKIWDAHVAHEAEDGTCLLYIDRHLVHEGARLGIGEVVGDGRGELMIDQSMFTIKMLVIMKTTMMIVMMMMFETTDTGWCRL